MIFRTLVQLEALPQKSKDFFYCDDNLNIPAIERDKESKDETINKKITTVLLFSWMRR